MGIFRADKEKDDLVLLFDIGSSSVGGALFWMQKSGVPKIVKAIREPIVLEENIDVGRFLSSTAKSLEIVASRIYMAGLGAPGKIFCVLSAPWYFSQTRVIRLEKNVPFIFTSKLADSLIQKEITLFEEEHLDKYRKAGAPVLPIEFKNIKTVLNGYETPNPLNQKAKELAMTVFISMSGEQILETIKEVIRKHFHFTEIKFSSFVLSSFAVVRDMYINQGSFLLIDIGGEVTDVSMVKNNTLCESVSFPLGLNFMIRGVASALNITLNEARSLFSLFRDGHAEVSTAKKLDPVIGKLKTEWLRKFQESLANLSSDISVPATIYVAVDRDEAAFFCQIIETEQFNQYTLTESKFKVVFLDARVFHGLAQFEENVIRDPFLIIDSIYINRFLTKTP
ncbi:hypothetical protein A3A05_02950 [Candidatus Nomurabacteria bacterium RIFCSPLOWO2_01_FULL_41_12]|uniref:SHS2 domain-containing protein n=1 Tax=Candidatus Nomurabacteria bacterium RIFCSPLOWO2_01_FULL_41_12 TaxID=1801774 RepID=A0A1F6WX90_9BACT|nr:MAG: hypothetical protein A3A05_02950 [Candidatus Nomurabacteria bacterium RIFCSPLOWO2_01_FULL_41_12]